MNPTDSAHSLHSLGLGLIPIGGLLGVEASKFQRIIPTLPPILRILRLLAIGPLVLHHEGC